MARNTVFKEYVLSVFVIFRKMGLYRRRIGLHGAVFIHDHNFTKIYLAICGWPQGHWHQRYFWWFSFHATFLPALLHSFVRNVRSFGFVDDLVFTSLSSGASFTCLPSIFPENAFIDHLYSLWNFTPEVYLLFVTCIGFFFLVFLPFLGPLPQHMEVPRPGVELEL